MGRLPPYSDEGMRGRLALAIIVLVGICLMALLFLDVPDGNREILSAVIGALLMRLADVYGYSFGTSAAQDRQNDTINTMARTTAQTTEAALGAPATLELGPHETAAVTPTADGAEISKEQRHAD